MQGTAVCAVPSLYIYSLTVIPTAKEMKYFYSLLPLTLLMSISLSACDSESPVAVESTPVFSTSELSGGDTTIFDASSHAFSIPAPNLSASAFEKHLEGDVEFEAVFVTAPASGKPRTRTYL